VTEIFGQHTGENLASYVCDIIEEYGVAGKLFCITADNASNNRTLARALEKGLVIIQHLKTCLAVWAML
jgi:hypothetical protein